MVKTEYLYGVKPKEISLEQTAREFLEQRIHLAQELLDELLNESIETRDLNRVRAVYDAINFNKSLLSQEI